MSSRITKRGLLTAAAAPSSSCSGPHGNVFRALSEQGAPKVLTPFGTVSNRENQGSHSVRDGNRTGRTQGSPRNPFPSVIGAINFDCRRKRAYGGKPGFPSVRSPPPPGG